MAWSTQNICANSPLSILRPLLPPPVLSPLDPAPCHARSHSRPPHPGMMGVVVEVVLEVRPHTPIISRGYTTYTKTGAEAVKAVLKARGRCDALFAILVPDRGYVYLETRTKVGMGFKIRLWVGFTVQECRLWWSRSGWFGPMCVGASPDVRCRCAWFLVVWQHGVSPEKLVGHEVVREGLGRSGVCFCGGYTGQTANACRAPAVVMACAEQPSYSYRTHTTHP